MKPIYIEDVGNNTFKGVLMCKSSESWTLTSSEVVLDNNEKIKMTDGSIVTEVDTNSYHILYENRWFKK